MESLLNRLPEWIDLEKARAVAVGLEGRGQVRVHDEEFEPGTADAVWLHRAGVEGWLVLTKDSKIRYRSNETEVLLAAKVRAFVLVSVICLVRKWPPFLSGLSLR
jgi:PIN like domain